MLCASIFSCEVSFLGNLLILWVMFEKLASCG